MAQFKKLAATFLLAAALFILVGFLGHPYHGQSQISFAPGSAAAKNYAVTTVLDKQQTANGAIVLAQTQQGETLCFEINQFLWFPFYEVVSVSPLQKDSFQSAMTDSFSVCAYKVQGQKIHIFEESIQKNYLQILSYIAFFMTTWCGLFALLRLKKTSAKPA